MSKVSIPVAAAGERASSRLPRNFALSVALGYCQRIGMIDNEQGEPRALLTNDVISPHLSLGVRFSCMGTGNHRHEHHGHNGNDRHHHGYDNGYDGYHHGHYGNHRHHDDDHRNYHGEGHHLPQRHGDNCG